MLSGEWAAAVWWNEHDSNDAIWLTDWFEWPNFEPNTIFESVSWSSWNDAGNPITTYDTAQAIIEDDQHDTMRITMDFEVVDLGEQDPNGVGGSPLSFRDANGTISFVFSERYICLQTYTIENISDSNITGLEFYQMLHSHPADNDDISSSISNYSSYCDSSFGDPLESYSPSNQVHQVDDFRYDITQWNAPTYSGDEHIDYIGFSSTVEPVAVDSNVFLVHITNI